MKSSSKILLTAAGLGAMLTLGHVMPIAAQDDPMVIVNENGERVEIPAPQEQRQGQLTVDALPGGGGLATREGSVTYTDDSGVEQTVDLSTARSVSVTQSSQIVVENGQQVVQQTGKMIVVDADGQRHEIDTSENGNAGSIVDADAMSDDDGEMDHSRPKQFMVGLHCGPVPELLQSHLNLSPETGLVVQHVLDGKPAAAAGIQKNDILLYADDQQLSVIPDLIAAVNRAGNEDAPLSITLVRAGEEIQVDVRPAEREEGSPAGLLPHQLGLDALDLDLDLDGMPMPGEELNLDDRFDQLRDQIEMMRKRMSEEMGTEMTQ